METKDMVKWAAIAVAGYLIYKWLEQNGMFGTQTLVQAAPGAGTQPALPAGTPVQPGTGAGVQTQAPAPGQSPQTVPPADPYSVALRAQEAQANPWVGPRPDDNALMLAAWDQSKVGTTGNYRLNASQWNWYRAQYAQSVLHLPDDKNTQYPTLESYCGDCQNMTASEYWAALKASGLSGLGSGWGSGYAFGVGGMGRGGVQ